jgi:hypothetical protein
MGAGYSGGLIDLMHPTRRLKVQRIILFETLFQGTPNRLEYTSDRHPRAMLEMMNLLRISHELSDVVLNVGSREPIYAHRYLICV